MCEALTMFRRIRVRAGSANFCPCNTPSVFLKHTRQTLPFQPVAVLVVVITTSYADPHNNTSLRNSKSVQRTANARRRAYCRRVTKEGARVAGSWEWSLSSLESPCSLTQRRQFSDAGLDCAFIPVHSGLLSGLASSTCFFTSLLAGGFWLVSFATGGSPIKNIPRPANIKRQSSRRLSM